MSREVIVFNKINSRTRFNYGCVEICRMSGLEKSQVSRFLNGKTELGVSKFFQLIRSMPKEFQEAYWEEMLSSRSVGEMLGGDRILWTELIAEASFTDIEEILNAITERWAGLRKAKEKEALVLNS